MAGEFITVKQAAAELCVPLRTAYDLVKDGRLASRRWGPRTIRIPVDAVERAKKCGLWSIAENGPPSGETNPASDTEQAPGSTQSPKIVNLPNGESAIFS